MRLGIFSGTFDPVHNGHLSAARQTKQQLSLDEVWLLVERTPRQKRPVANYEHRVGMAKAVSSKWLKVVEVEDDQHSLETLTKLPLNFDHQLYVLVGADVAPNVPRWSGYESLIEKAQIVVIDRPSLTQREWPEEFAVIKHLHPASSKGARSSRVIFDQHIPKEAQEYAQKHSLYH